MAHFKANFEPILLSSSSWVNLSSSFLTTATGLPRIREQLQNAMGIGRHKTALSGRGHSIIPFHSIVPFHHSIPSFYSAQ
jgi:hypothetical protein